MNFGPHFAIHASSFPSRFAHGGREAVLRGPSRTGIQRIEREDEPRRMSLEAIMRYCRRTLKSTPANRAPMPNAVADIIAYHDRTKHQPERYANGPHG